MTTKKRPNHYGLGCFFKLTKSFNHRHYFQRKAQQLKDTLQKRPWKN